MYNKGISREIYNITCERFRSFFNKSLLQYFTMALIKEYFALTKKYTAEYGEKTVVLLQVGAFFEVYGQIITPAAEGGGGTVTCSGSRIDDFCLIYCGCLCSGWYKKSASSVTSRYLFTGDVFLDRCRARVRWRWRCLVK